MSKRHIFIVVTALMSMFGHTALANEHDSGLSEAISDLSAPDTEVVISALEKMGRVCDESCVPWLSDMMRHPETSVIQAACRAASATGNPRLAPPLLEVIRRHPMNEVRLEALKALTRLERPEDYEALLATIDPEAPDEIQRRILRSLPKDMRQSQVSRFASWARHGALVTSVADAYRDAPELLFNAVIKVLMQTSDLVSRQNLFRTLAVLAPYLPESFHLSAEQEALFWDNPEPCITWIAAIQASLSSADAVRWLLAWSREMPKASLLEVMEKLHGNGARQFGDAVIQADDDGNMLSWKRDIASNQALAHAFLQLMAQQPGEHAKALAMTLRYDADTDMAISAWQILGHFADDPEIRGQLTALLGHSNVRIAVAAMHIVANNPELSARLVPIVLESPEFDGVGRVYLARWALVMAVHARSFECRDNSCDAIVLNAQQVLGDSRRLHSEPALRLLNALNAQPEPPSVEAFEKMRSDMKRAWLQTLESSQKSTSGLVMKALTDADAAVVAEAWRVLSNHSEWTHEMEKTVLDVMLTEAMRHEHSMVGLQAIAAAAHLERTSVIPTLQNLLTHADTRLAYNALWALQKLRALPHAPWLRSLYYRASDGLLRERLGFLTGLDTDRREYVEMSELYSRQPIRSHELLHIQTQNQPRAAYEMSFIQADQSLAMERANVYGFIWVP